MPNQDALPARHQETQETLAVSGLLRAWGKGDLKAREKLMPLVYQELRHRAAAYLRRVRLLICDEKGPTTPFNRRLSSTRPISD
jgi:hypothetical protein